MRRPLVLCALSFLLGIAAVWLCRQREIREFSTDARAVVDPPTGGIPVPTAEGRLSGTLDGLLDDDALIDQDDYDERWSAVEVAPGPYPGSALPLPDGGAPSDEYTVKGIAEHFHTTESPQYPRVRAQLWFRNPTDAERAGLTRWDT
ncbi:sunset domain-containing protein [Actinokineospora sp. 24-640]